MIPLRVLMPESPRWLASKGRILKADKIVSMLENEAVKEGKPLPEPVIRPVDPKFHEPEAAGETGKPRAGDEATVAKWNEAEAADAAEKQDAEGVVKK